MLTWNVFTLNAPVSKELNVRGYDWDKWMRNLILIRHAKSSWDDPSLIDLERPLNKRGKHDAQLMGKLLLERNLLPDLIVSSPAKRALKTAAKIAKTLGYEKARIEIRLEIYMQGLQAILNVISELPDNVCRAYLVGHNPEFTDLANRLTDGAIDNVPTCGIVSIEFPGDSWHHCVKQKGRLALFLRPPKAPQKYGAAL